MTYDMQLGMLATEAAAELLQAKASGDLPRYQALLRKTSDFCRSLRESSAQPSSTIEAPQEAREFLSAVLKTAKSRPPAIAADLNAKLSEVEGLIEGILRENRNPSGEEELQIAQVLYLASAAEISRH